MTLEHNFNLTLKNFCFMNFGNYTISKIEFILLWKEIGVKLFVLHCKFYKSNSGKFFIYIERVENYQKFFKLLLKNYNKIICYH